MPQSRVHWQYYFARKFSLQRFEIVARALMSDFFKEHFNVHLKNVLIQPVEGGNHGIWFDAHEYEQAIRRIYYVVCRDLRAFFLYKRLTKRVQRAWGAAARDVGRRVTPKLTNAELATHYDRFIYHHQEHFNKAVWIPFAIELVLAKDAEEALVRALKRSGNMGEYDYWLRLVFSAEEANAITRMELALLELAVRIKARHLQGKARIQALERIAKEFSFIPCYDVIDAPWDEEHFCSELEALLKRPLGQLEAEREDLRDRFPKRRQEFRTFLKKFPMRRRERELLIMAHEFVFIRDERDDYRRLGCFYGRPLFAEIGRHLGLTQKEAAYLTIDETKDFLHLGLPPPFVAEVRERVRGYLLLRKGGGPMTVASGRAMARLIKLELGKQKVQTQQEVRGAVGSPGKVRGVVSIVRTKHDLRRVGEGAIMVAVTTSPDYVPAMRRAAAIVTDEGGLTSHAAIVARELSIPCVVGCRIATRTFKDGERVEVDASAGIVRKV